MSQLNMVRMFDTDGHGQGQAQQAQAQAQAQAEAGPSRARPRPRKPTAPHPSSTSASASNAKKKRKLPPPLPRPPIASTHPSASIHPKRSAPTARIKTLQGVSKVRSDTAKDGFGREVIFVTRKTGLGTLMGRCRSLVVHEGYTSLRFHAIGAAIPQAMLLLYALLDLLPYPVGDKGMWYEIRTGSVECIDEVGAKYSAKKVPGDGTGNDQQETGQGKAGDQDEDHDLDWLDGMGDIEEDTPERRSRIKSTIQIDLHISPKPKRKPESQFPSSASAGNNGGTTTTTTTTVKTGPAAGARKTIKRNRPSKKRRTQLAAKRAANDAEGGGEHEEEEMMNIDETPREGKVDTQEEEEEEEIEEVEQ
ncbi:hypothetical protein IAT40_002359 [Kwoniella sp. CBS 6097]